MSHISLVFAYFVPSMILILDVGPFPTVRYFLFFILSKYYTQTIIVVYFIQGQSVIWITRYKCFVDHCSSFSPLLPLYCLSFLHLRFLVTHLVSSHFYLNNMQTSHHQYIEKWSYKEGWRYQRYSIRLKHSCFLSGPIDKFSVDLLCLFAHSGAQRIFFPSSCVAYVVSFSGLSIFDCPFGIL